MRVKFRHISKCQPVKTMDRGKVELVFIAKGVLKV
jgi:hypothetical protein